MSLKDFSEVGLPVTYDGLRLEVGYRIDLLVKDSMIVELKSVDQLRPVRKARSERDRITAQFQHSQSQAKNYQSCKLNSHFTYFVAFALIFLNFISEGSGLSVLETAQCH